MFALLIKSFSKSQKTFIYIYLFLNRKIINNKNKVLVGGFEIWYGLLKKKMKRFLLNERKKIINGRINACVGYAENICKAETKEFVFKDVEEKEVEVEDFRLE